MLYTHGRESKRFFLRGIADNAQSSSAWLALILSIRFSAISFKENTPAPPHTTLTHPREKIFMPIITVLLYVNIREDEIRDESRSILALPLFCHRCPLLIFNTAPRSPGKYRFPVSISTYITINNSCTKYVRTVKTMYNL